MKVNKNLIKDLEKATGIKFESIRNSSYITNVHRDFILAYRAVEDITDAECALIFNTSRQAENKRRKSAIDTPPYFDIISHYKQMKIHLKEEIEIVERNYGIVELSELIKTD